jgi:lipopolysaccharide heptosyltransferase III
MPMEVKDIKFDCRFFKGEIPCTPNKLSGKVCPTCDEYSAVQTRILIIKLGALGDVIRTTPLITRFRKIYPGCHISWITQSPGILPHHLIDKIYSFNFESVYALTHRQYDIAINLDKEIEACALLADVSATKKFGFTWKDNRITPATINASHKLITGAFDNISIKNTKSYLEEIFEICHLRFEGEEYVLPVNDELVKKWNVINEKANGKKIIGLNTGCGHRWQTRLWRNEYWIELIKQLQLNGYFPMVLGGPDEHESNLNYSTQTGVYYPGTFSLQEFIALSSHCHVIVSAVSMMMHIAIGLKIPLILFNNIFNKHEFELYGRGMIVSPKSGCDCYYGNTCKRSHHCMNDLSVEEVYSAIKKFS